ncbi:DUF4760 domain-containing protein [Vibrio fluvialis]|nr:DUF4760 domain-containing protein [Vibrio fluvialis]
MATEAQSFLELYLHSPPAVVGTIAAIFAFITLWRNHSTDKVSNSIDFISSINDKDTRELIIEMQRFFAKANNKSPIHSFKTYVELANKSTVQIPEKIAIITIINEWERCANGIYYKAYDSNFLYGVYAGTVTRTYFNLLPYLLVRQADHCRSSIKFSRLALDWHIKKSKEKHIPVSPRIEKALKHLVKHHKLVYSPEPLRRFQLMRYNWFEDKDPDLELAKYHEEMTSYLLEINENEGLTAKHLKYAGWDMSKPMTIGKLH